MKNPRHIVITGASSGLGAALARYYAAPGIVLHLQGRHHPRLAEVADICREKGAVIHMRCLDVTDAPAVEAWLKEADAMTPIDMVIANAGISAGIGGGGESAAQTRAIFATNIDGVVNTLQPLLSAMVIRRHGQIAIMSSLAGLRGLASSPAYSASKACMRVYGEGLRGWLGPFGVEVSVVCPGFIRTPMTAVNPYYMPFMMEADKAAGIIAKGLAKNKARIPFPYALYWPMCLFSMLPIVWTDRFFSRLPGKPSFISSTDLSSSLLPPAM